MSAFKKRMTGLLQRRDSSSQTHLQTEEITNEALSNAPLSQVMDTFFRSAQTSDNLVALSLIPERTFQSQAHAQETAKIMRKKMTDWTIKSPGELYNCVMLIPILVKHEQGHMFTVNVDDRFAGTVAKVLRDAREESMSIRALLNEILTEFDDIIAGRWETGDHHAAEKAIQQARWRDDAGAQRLVALRRDPKNWQWLLREQRSMAHMQAPRFQQQQLQPPPPQLPGVLELSERLKEANTSANILEQAIHSHATDLTGLFSDDLFREFSQRCSTSKVSLQQYIDMESSGQFGHPYDEATIGEIISTATRVGTVLRLRDAKQDAYNVQRSKSRSPRPSGFSAPSGPTSGHSGTAVLTAVQPPESRPLDPSARLDNPFDDSNGLRTNENGNAHAGNAIPRFGSNATSRPSLAVSTGGQTGSDNDRTTREDASSREQRTQQSRYVF